MFCFCWIGLFSRNYSRLVWVTHQKATHWDLRSWFYRWMPYTHRHSRGRRFIPPMTQPTRGSLRLHFFLLTLSVGRREGHPACKKWGDDGGGQSLVRMKWHPAGWSVFLPPLIFPCTMKSRSYLLAPAYPGGPGKRAVKRLWWCGTFSKR